MGREINKPLKGYNIELVGAEGAHFEYFKIIRVGGKQFRKPRKDEPIHLILDVVGFVDEIAPSRNWGKYSKSVIKGR